MGFKKVAVMMGGTSAERPVSLKTGALVLTALKEEGIDAEEFDPAHRSLAELQNNFTEVYIALHGRGGEDGTIQGALELMRIPYTGSSVLGSAIAMDKVMTKRIWVGLGYPTARDRVLYQPDYKDIDAEDILNEFGLPLIVKPAQEGSSMGTLMVESLDALKRAIQVSFKYGNTVLVEQFIHGREFSVSILNDDVLPPVEVKLNGDLKYFSAEAKADDTSVNLVCPADLTEEEDNKLRKLGKKAFQAIGCSNYGRVDVLMDKQGALYLLEVNSIPGMTTNSLMPRAGKTAGLSYNQLVLEIVKGAALKSTLHKAWPTNLFC